jgi:hypothetical protein
MTALGTMETWTEALFGRCADHARLPSPHRGGLQIWADAITPKLQEPIK